MSNNWNRLLNENGYVTPQQISDFDQMRKEYRETITLYQKPLTTLNLFFAGALALLFSCIQYLILHSIFLYIILPGLLIWFILDQIPGQHTEYLNIFEFWIEYIVWWVGLGILSSVGLGSGLQSGVLFLFPHIIKVSLAAQTCKTLDFESVTDIWFRSPTNLFKCSALTPDSTPVTIFGVWKKIILVCFLQSAGTAIGEIPPYWMTKVARLAAIESGTIDSKDLNMPEELETNSRFSFINKAKLWMIWFLRTHGFFGVLVMASYPNIAFDLCGICCGHFLMPFWTFFGATFLGKTIIRNGYQSIIYVMLCSEEYLEILIGTLQQISPDQLHLDQHIREVIEEGRESFKNFGKTNNNQSLHEKEIALSTGVLFMVWWKVIMILLISVFFLSCISHFAQYYQMTIDQADSNKLRKRLPTSVRLELASPNTGRLKLPPPTPATTKVKSNTASNRENVGNTPAINKIHSNMNNSHQTTSLNKEAQPKVDHSSTSDHHIQDSKKRE